MDFHDEFMPSESDDLLDSGEEGAGEEDELLELPSNGEEDGSEVEFVPPGGAAPAPASAASSAASSAGIRPVPPEQKKLKNAGKTAARAPENQADIASTRKLARLTSNPKPDSPVAMPLLCIVGHPLKHPVPVHPVKVDSKGKQWIQANEHQHWLRRACANFGTTHYEVHFQAAVTTLREEFYKLITEARKNDTTEGQQQAIRKGMGISDSESESHPRNSSRKRKLRRDSREHADDLQVNFQGVAMRVRNQQRPLCIECTAAVVSAIVAFCKEKAEEHAAAPPTSSAGATARQALHREKQASSSHTPGEGRAAPAAPTPSAQPQAFSMAGLSVGITGKVTWQPSAACWAVHYKDGGKTAVTRVRVKVPGKSSKKSLFGAQKHQPDADQMASLRENAFREACTLWNQLDTSKRDRIDLEDSGAP